MGPDPSLDYSAVLNSFLLPAFVARMEDPRLSGEERLQLRFELDSYLESWFQKHPRSAPQILRHIESVFLFRELSQPSMVLWYLELLAEHDETWHEQANPELLRRFCRDLPHGRVRRRAFEVLFLVELRDAERTPWASSFPSLFRQEGRDQAGQFTEWGGEIVRFLLTQALTAPDRRGTISLNVLRHCLAERYQAPPKSLVLALVDGLGDIGPRIRADFIRRLSTQE